MLPTDLTSKCLRPSHRFDPIALRVSVAAVSWERVLAQIATVDPIAGERLEEFYAKCLLYNPLRPTAAAPIDFAR